jgi:hypothetical protein
MGLEEPLQKQAGNVNLDPDFDYGQVCPQFFGGDPLDLFRRLPHSSCPPAFFGSGLNVDPDSLPY